MQEGIRENTNEAMLKCVGELVERGDFDKRMNELNFSENDSELIWNLISVDLNNSPKKDSEIEFQNALNIFNLK